MRNGCEKAKGQESLRQRTRQARWKGENGVGDKMKANFSMQVGRAVCSEVRNYLNAMKFKGFDIEFLESPGWFVRTFTVRGEIDDVRKIFDDCGRVWPE